MITNGSGSLKIVTATSFTLRIYIAGDYAAAKEIVAKYCYEVGDCYSITPFEYIYTGGVEAGVCVTRINYARFPADESEILARVVRLAGQLCRGLFQKSYSIEGPRQTIYYFADCPVGVNET